MNRGFTLIELVIGMALFSTLSLLIFDFWNSSITKNDHHIELNLAMDLMRKDIMQAKSCCGGNNLYLQMQNAGGVRWYVKAGRLIRQENNKHRCAVCVAERIKVLVNKLKVKVSLCLGHEKIISVISMRNS